MVTISRIAVTNAKQIDAVNWLAVRDVHGPNAVPGMSPRGDCIVQIGTLPRNNAAEWKHIAWSGGQPIPGKPNQRRISRGATMRNDIEASVGNSRRKLTLWILWADIKVLTKGPRPAIAKRWSEGVPFPGPDKCGAFEVDSFSMGKNARGQVVAVGQLLPSGIGKILVAKHTLFKIRRQVTAHDFADGKRNKHKKSFVKWAEDTLLSMQVLDVRNDRLYDTDAPDLPTGLRTAETYNNFRQWVEWEGKPCSNYTYWYFQARWMNKQVTLKDVGQGTINLPSDPFYK